MDREREPIFESGFSEKQLDIAVDKTANNDQTKGGSIFDPKKKVVKEKIILDSTTQ